MKIIESDGIVDSEILSTSVGSGSSMYTVLYPPIKYPQESIRTPIYAANEGVIISLPQTQFLPLSQTDR